MDSLDAFRKFWQAEIHNDKSNQPSSSKNISQIPVGELGRLGQKGKRPIDCDTSTPPVSHSIHPSESLTTSTSFTIGVGTFIASNNLLTKSTTATESSCKKQKISQFTLLDELIRDIDESTDVPFFNVSLPREIALNIFYRLSIKDLYSCSQVCKSWYTLSSDNQLWYHLYRNSISNKINKYDDRSWKDLVRETTLSNKELINNFKNHQCRTTKLTNHLGIVLTCANNDKTSIIAGYSTGIIRTWSIEAILNSADDELLDTSDIIYESTDISPGSTLASVKAVGFLQNDVYAVHDDGLVEVWRKEIGDRPRYTQQMPSSCIEQIRNDDNILCLTNYWKLFVLNLHDNEANPQYRELNFHNEYNDRILSMCMSSQHSVPVSIVATRKSLWCIALSNIEHRHSFYSLLESECVQQIPLDIHNEEPLAVVGLDREIKLFDLQYGHCNIVLTNYKNLPSSIKLIRAHECPANEFAVAYDNFQISLFDRRQKDGAIHNFYNHSSTITTLQVDSWRLASTDVRGFVRLWDRRMSPHSLWHMNPQLHPVSHCRFDQRTLIFSLTPVCKTPDMIDYQIEPDQLSGHIYVCDFQSDVTTKLDDDLKICTSSYDVPQASTRRIAMYTPYDIIED